MMLRTQFFQIGLLAGILAFPFMAYSMPAREQPGMMQGGDDEARGMRRASPFLEVGEVEEGLRGFLGFWDDHFASLGHIHPGYVLKMWESCLNDTALYPPLPGEPDTLRVLRGQIRQALGDTRAVLTLWKQALWERRVAAEHLRTQVARLEEARKNADCEGGVVALNEAMRAAVIYDSKCSVQIQCASVVTKYGIHFLNRKALWEKSYGEYREDWLGKTLEDLHIRKKQRR